MIATQPERYAGFTFWILSSGGRYTACVEAARWKIAKSDRTFNTASEAIAYAKSQIDIVNCLFWERKSARNVAH